MIKNWTRILGNWIAYCLCSQVSCWSIKGLRNKEHVIEWDICLLAVSLRLACGEVSLGIWVGGSEQQSYREALPVAERPMRSVCAAAMAPTSGHFNIIKRCLNEHSIHFFLKPVEHYFANRLLKCLIYWLQNSHSAVNLPPWFGLRIFIFCLTLDSTLRGYYRKEFNKSNIIHF